MITLEKTHQVMTFFLTACAVVGILIAASASKADKTALEELKSLHIQDMASLKKVVIKMDIQKYNDQIFILDNKPNKTEHDLTTLRYLKSTKADLVREIGLVN